MAFLKMAFSIMTGKQGKRFENVMQSQKKLNENRLNERKMNLYD